MGADTVKIFCPKCQNVYHPPPIRSRNHSIDDIGCASVDGAAFGTTFPHLFLMTYHNLVPEPLTLDSAYIPRVFGFRVHQSARSRNNKEDTTTSSVNARSNRRLQAMFSGVSADISQSNTAEVDAVDVNTDTARLPQGQDDNTAASPANNAAIKIENDSSTKGNQGTGSNKIKNGVKVKTEDTSASSKRKGKSNNSNGDVDAKVKRQKWAGTTK